jgi:hypothetical protein
MFTRRMTLLLLLVQKMKKKYLRRLSGLERSAEDCMVLE